MAEWQYQIHRIELESGGDLDRRLEQALTEYGGKGWELVQILQHQDPPNSFALILKAPKPLD